MNIKALSRAVKGSSKRSINQLSSGALLHSSLSQKQKEFASELQTGPIFLARKGGTPKSMVNNEVVWRMLADRLSA